MTGKVAVVTGGSQGIGAGIVAGYRQRGWSVVASARAIEPSADPDLATVAGDIADPATADRIIGAALDRFGRVDSLVNDAGVWLSKPFTEYSAGGYARAVGVNLTGFFWITQRAIEHASRGIRVNAVSPGVIQTPAHPAESYENLGDRTPPIGRAGQVSDVVNGILFLESSPYITGEILHIDGGQIAGH